MPSSPKIKITKQQIAKYKYDDWLEFFRKVPAADLTDEKTRLEREIPTEGYAALCRWLEIIENPSKMDKLYQGRLKAQESADIMEIAVGDDDEAFWTALIRENVAQLNSSTSSPQEVARLSQNLGIFRDKLHEIRARKPKKDSVLEKVLEAAATPKKQAPKKTAKVTKKKKTVAKSRKEKDVQKAPQRRSNAKS